MSKNLWAFVVLTCWLSAGYAYEVDNFTNRYKPLADATKVLNTEVNSRIRFALKAVNETNVNAKLKKNLNFNKNCNTKDLYEAVSDELLAGTVGALEEFATDSKSVAKSDKKNEKIYKAKHSNTFLDMVGIEPSINLHGHYVGVDKMGHFFDQGKEYYDVVEKTKGSTQQKISAALAHGQKLENGMYGLSTTGVKSHGDLAANYEGYLFWSQLVSGVNPYFKCSDGLWVQIRDFDWGQYVNPAWDEAVNCSVYEKDFAEEVKKNQRNLEFQAKNKHKYVCPVSLTQCRKMIERYGDRASQIVSPTCINLAKSSTPSSANDDYYATQPVSPSPATGAKDQPAKREGVNR